jgi:hypothetical protein
VVLQILEGGFGLLTIKLKNIDEFFSVNGAVKKRGVKLVEKGMVLSSELKRCSGGGRGEGNI